jgi:hypothetical protein
VITNKFNLSNFCYHKAVVFFIGSVFSLNLSSCGVSPSSPSIQSGGEDTSASGIVASVFGGTLSASIGTGTFNYVGRFTATCPTLLTSGAGCSSSGSSGKLTLNSCNFSSSTATWASGTTGYVLNSFSGTTPISCGTFPTPSNDTFQRQFITSGGAASTITRTTSNGTVLTIDDTTAGVNANYENDHFDGSGASGALISGFNSGAGKTVNFVAGSRVSAQALETVSTAGFNYTVAGTLPVSETTSSGATTWSTNVGTVSQGACTSGITVYDNQAKIMGTTCFKNVIYNNSCCTPVSGTIVTSFASTSQSSGSLSSAMNGTSERLTFSGCGSGVLSDYKGGNTLVTLPHCM